LNINFPDSAFDGSQVNTKDVSPSSGIKSAEGAAKSRPQSMTGSQEVSLSDINVSALKSQLASLPNVRQDRVQALREAIRKGTFEVNNRQLADAIHADLFGPANTES
jgi:flagellar biosynthesis anti-sigma factor FlgM